MPSTSLVECQFEFHDADGIGIKQMYAQKRGTRVPQHSHTYDHTSMLALGKVALYANGVYQGVFRAPCGILIKAGVKHEFMTLEDETIIYCIHNISRAEKIEIADEHQLDLGV